MKIPLDVCVPSVYTSLMTTDALDRSKVLYDETVEFLRSLTTAGQNPILYGDQAEDVAFALITNVDLLTRLAEFYSLAEPTYEYCVMHPSFPDSPHRPHDGVWPLVTCERWIEQTNRMASDFGSESLGFYVARRSVGPWERV